MSSRSNGRPAVQRRRAPSVPFSLDLKQEDGSVLHLDLRLAFDMNAIAAAEAETALNMLRGDIWEAMNGRVLSVLFWAALLAYHPEYAGQEGLEVVRSYIEPGNYVAVSKAVADAYMLSQPDKERAEMRAQRDRPTGSAANGEPPTGSTSGPSPDTISVSATENSVN